MANFTLQITDPTTKEDVWFSVSDVLNKDREWRSLVSDLLDDSVELTDERIGEALAALHRLLETIRAQISIAHTPAEASLHREKVLAVIDWTLTMITDRCAYRLSDLIAADTNAATPAPILMLV